MLKGRYYTGVRSDYIRKLIRQTSWTDEKRRQYVDDLITLEGCILHPPSEGYGVNGYYKLRIKYRKEFKIIYKELRPKQLKERLKEDKQIEKDYKVAMGNLEQGEQKIRNSWIKAGGKV